MINHRATTTGWFDFPTETYNNVTYTMTSEDVAKNDDGGKALTEAQKEGVQLSSNLDSGEDWDGMRDLDHNSINVQNTCESLSANAERQIWLCRFPIRYGKRLCR